MHIIEWSTQTLKWFIQFMWILFIMFILVKSASFYADFKVCILKDQKVFSAMCTGFSHTANNLKPQWNEEGGSLLC